QRLRWLRHSLCDVPDRRNERCRDLALADKRVGATVVRLLPNRRIDRRGHDQDLDLGSVALDLFRRLASIESRAHEVHQDNIGSLCQGHNHPGFPIALFTEHGNIVFWLKREIDHRPEVRIVVYNQHTNRHVPPDLPASGIASPKYSASLMPVAGKGRHKWSCFVFGTLRRPPGNLLRFGAYNFDRHAGNYYRLNGGGDALRNFPKSPSHRVNNELQVVRLSDDLPCLGFAHQCVQSGLVGRREHEPRLLRGVGASNQAKKRPVRVVWWGHVVDDDRGPVMLHEADEVELAALEIRNFTGTRVQPLPLENRP